MAALAPIFFNFSILIIVATLFRRSRLLGDLLALQPHWSGRLVLLVFVGLPAMAGFAMGASRCARLLGHFFYTNMDSEKDVTKTIAAWGGLLLIAYLLSRAM